MVKCVNLLFNITRFSILLTIGHQSLDKISLKAKALENLHVKKKKKKIAIANCIGDNFFEDFKQGMQENLLNIML